jgi:competence protein ComEC
LVAGQAVRVSGVTERPKGAQAEGLFDYAGWLRRQGIYYALQATSEQDWQVLSSPGHPPLADRFRDWGRASLSRGLPREDESLRLEWALTLGWKPALTEEVSEPFIRAATYHIFAVDGLRMAIVFGIAFGLLRVLRFPRAVCGAVLIPLIWFYVALTGWPASAIRATVMLTIVITGWTLKRPSDLINSLFAAALMILVWQPQQLFQAGFQLSFLVVLCLVLMAPILHEWGKRLIAPDPLLPVSLRPRRPAWVEVPGMFVWGVALSSFAAWIGSLPLVAYYFNIFTPVSTPANLWAVPACGLVLISNLSSLMLAGWFPAGSELFNHAGWALMESIRGTSVWFAALPGAYWYVPAPSLFTSVFYYGVLLGLLTGWLLPPRFRWWKFGLLLIASGCWIWQWAASYSVSTVTVLPVTGTAAIYCDFPGRSKDVLIDCGNANAIDWTTKPFLRSRGVNRLPNLAVTHGDATHVGGATELGDLFAVEHVWASPVRFRSPGYRQAIDYFRQTPGRVREIRKDDRVDNWTVLYPDGSDHFPQADDNALVLMGQIGQTKLLLLSDLGRPGQRALLERTGNVRADIVIGGLPETGEPLSDALLDAINPQAIVITDAEYPASNRASPKVRERLGKRNVPVFYTRTAGAVTVRFSKRGWELSSMHGETIRGQQPASR